MLEATNDWSLNIDKGLLNGVVFIDLKPHLHLHVFLDKSTFQAIRCFLSCLNGRTQRCDVNGKLSTASDLGCGGPQGSILGTFAMSNDLPNCLRAVAPRVFADDTNITLSAKTLTDGTQKQALILELSNLSCRPKANKLSLNVAKTELMMIGSRQRLSVQNEDVEIRIDVQIIKNFKESLGVTIGAQLTWCKHVEEIYYARKYPQL